MNDEEFEAAGQQLIKYAIDYKKNIRERRVMPDVKPGFMRKLLPDHAPHTPEKWDQLFKDIERVIMPGMAHWHHPHFYAYFPTANSYPATLADILSDTIACIGFNWESCPSCTELEVIVLDWLVKVLDLPETFLSTSPGHGGGVIQGTASEATLVAVLSARTKFLNTIKENNLDIEDGAAVTKLIAYTSRESHSSVERAYMIALVKYRILDTDEKQALRGDTLKKAINEDRAKGLTPFFVCVTLGSTSSCAFDNCKEIGLVCEREDIWMHIDAAYAGGAFICPEYRPLLDGVEHADSFNFNPHKWLQVTFHCSAMWVKNSKDLIQSFRVERIYLKNGNEEIMPNYRHWQIPFGQRFRSLKLWFVLRLFGIKGLQDIIRQDIKLAHKFEEYIRNDRRFEIFGEVIMALICFRLKGSNEINEKLIKRINEDGRIYMVPSKVGDTFFLRLAICTNRTQNHDIDFAWKVVSKMADNVLKAAN